MLFIDNDIEYIPFIEPPGIRVRVNPTGGMDTSGWDVYRQGVEIVTDAQRYLGPMKITAGSADHVTPKLVYGQAFQYSDGVAFREKDIFDALGYVTAGGNVEEPYIPNEIPSNDGAAEPLSIRSVVSYFSPESPFFAHAVYGSVSAGNSDAFGRSDMVETVCPLDEPSYLEKSSFFDAQDALSLGTFHLAYPGIGSEIQNLISPYIDNVVTRSSMMRVGARMSTYYFDVYGVTPDFIDDDDMNAAIAAMTGTLHDDDIRFGYISMNTGFTYERPSMKLIESSSAGNVVGVRYATPYDIGYDSIAFGGMLQ